MFSSGKIKNFHLWGIKVLVFIIPLLPLFVSTSMVFPFITGKNFLFRTLVEFAAALWIGLIITSREYRLRNSLMVISVLIFTFVVGLADLMGVSPYNSFWSNYERMEGYVTILHLALYFMILKSVLRTRRDWNIFFNIFIVASIFVSLSAFLIGVPVEPTHYSRYVLEYGDRIHGTIGNPPFLAAYLLCSIFLGGVLFVNAERIYFKCYYLSAIIINSVTVYFSASRGAILAAFIGVIILSQLYVWKSPGLLWRKRIRTILLPAGLLIVISAVFLVLKNSDIINHDRTLTRFSTMLSDDSVRARFNSWEMAWNGIKERPVLGWGQENFIGVYTVNLIPYIKQQVWTDRAHNIIIDWLINAGFLGLFSYLLMFAAAFYLIKTAYRKQRIKKSEALVIFTAFIVYFIQNLFTFDTINTYLIFFALLAYVDNCVTGENRSGPGPESSPDSYKTIIDYISATAAALLCVSFIFYFVNYKPLKQNLQMFRISHSSPEHDSYSVLLSEFNEALSYDTFGNAALLAKMMSVSNVILKMNDFDRDGAIKFIQATTEELGKEIALYRHDLEYLTNAINFFKKIAVYEKSFIARSEALIKECIRMTPEYHWLYKALADVYILKKDYESAYANMGKIVEWDPQNDEKHLKLALAAIYISRDDILNSSLEKARKIRAAKDRRIASGRMTVLSAAEIYEFANAYREIGEYQKSLKYLKELTIILSYNEKWHVNRDFHFHKPHNKARIHFELAKMYLMLNDKKNAVKEAQKASKLDALKFKEKAAGIIDSGSID